jgi:undecaprenyl-diphosphatase
MAAPDGPGQTVDSRSATPSVTAAEPRPAPAPAPSPALTAARLLAGFAALLLVGWGAGELWLSLIGSSELDLMREVVAARTSAWTALARIVTWAGSAFVLVPLALAIAVPLYRAGHRREALVVVICLGGAMLLSDLVKLLVSRPRPPVSHLQPVTGSSWPSGHATQAGAFWFSLVAILPALQRSARACRGAAAVAALVVLAVAASRVYLGVHYPSDVVAGALLGVGWTAVVWSCLERGRAH